MKSLIKNTISKLYFYFIENRLLNWVDSYKKEQLKTQFKSVGSNFRIEFPFYKYGLEWVEIGQEFSASNNFRLECIARYGPQNFTPSIKIGNGVNIEKYCHIGCINKVVIGNNVLIASNVYISDHSHGDISEADLKVSPSLRPLNSKGPVIIHDDVWIGQGVCILPNVTIGKNAIIGANSVVTKDIPERAVVAGNPAKIIKYLY